MKQTLNVSGEVVFDEKEVASALLELAKSDPQVLSKAIDLFLQSRFGMSASKVSYSYDQFGQLKVKSSVQPIGGKHRTIISFNPKAPNRNTPSGFTKKNLGFYSELLKYLDIHRKKGKKQIPFERLLMDLQKTFPNLDSRRCYIYLADKRQQQSKGFSFDNRKRAIVL